MAAAAAAPPIPSSNPGDYASAAQSIYGGQQQAANLSGGPASNGYRLAGPTSATIASATVGGADIQIGAYASVAEAERQLQLARSKAGDLIGGAPAITQPVTANGKQMWRARFAGFQATTASTICSELRRRQIDCLVSKSQ